MQAVVPMDHKYLAENDGSELASGRGSGTDKRPRSEEEQEDRRVQIPYMNMVYAPIERRLDMAVWRSLFASSARQARQFVIHGNVKVNGQKVGQQEMLN
jgi:ribosomal protein S4